MVNLETVYTYEGTHDIHTPDHRRGAHRHRGLLLIAAGETMERLGTTLTQHIRSSRERHPAATGEFSLLLHEIAVARKIISREVNRAGILEEVLGLAGKINVQGEEVQKLDEYANDTSSACSAAPATCALMASEEVADPIPIPQGRAARRVRRAVRSARRLVEHRHRRPRSAPSSRSAASARRRRATASSTTAAPGPRAGGGGYVIYGSSTMLVYTAGNGVARLHPRPHGRASSSSPIRDIRIPGQGAIYSVNEGNSARWAPRQRDYVALAQGGATRRPAGPTASATSARWSPTSTAPCSRAASSCIPADNKIPQGKLRYLYEAAPLAFMCEQAGGAASTGSGRSSTSQPSGAARAHAALHRQPRGRGDSGALPAPASRVRREDSTGACCQARKSSAGAKEKPGTTGSRGTGSSPAWRCASPPGR